MTGRAAAGALALALATAALTGCAASTAPAAPVGHAEFQLVGSWTGEPDADGNGVISMLVEAAASDGSGFDGELTFAAAGARLTEPVHAAMTPHGHLVAGIGDGASAEVHITGAGTLDYCFVRYGTDPVHACGTLVRDAP